MNELFSIFLWMYWALCIIPFFVIVLVVDIVTYPFDPHHQISNSLLRILSALMLRTNPGWSFNIKGADKTKVSQPTIVVANHQSFLDLAMLYLLPWSMKWVAKKALFKIPILGWMIYLTGHIPINRKSIRSAKKISRMIDVVKQGEPLMIFPEGTRTPTGEIQRLKTGAFKMAKLNEFNILPVVLDGSYQAMSRGNWAAHPKQQFSISVLEPISPDSYESADEIKETVSVLFKQELANLRK